MCMVLVSHKSGPPRVSACVNGLYNMRREPHRIPREYLVGTKAKLGAELPDAPLVVFINSRSGGRAGARLTQVLCHVIGHVQASSLLCPHPHGLACPLLSCVKFQC